MKKLGLIGGLTPESTAVYYRLLNETIKTRLGTHYSSEMLLSSFNLNDVMPLFLHNKPGYITAITKAGEHLAAGGVNALMILSNSAHMAAENVAKVTGLPVIHILDALAKSINASEVKRPLLLGTDFVMQGDFYRPYLQDRINAEIIIPSHEDCKAANDILFSELANGEIRDESRQTYLDIINKAEAEGADSVILGCTEHCLLLDQSHHHLPFFDSTHIHAEAAVDFQLA